MRCVKSCNALQLLKYESFNLQTICKKMSAKLYNRLQTALLLLVYSLELIYLLFLVSFFYAPIDLGARQCYRFKLLPLSTSERVLAVVMWTSWKYSNKNNYKKVFQYSKSVSCLDVRVFDCGPKGQRFDSSIIFF